MRPLDPRLLRHARASRRYLAASVMIGVATAGLIVAQASLLADSIAAAVAGAGLHALQRPLALLGAVVVGRAVTAWAQEVAAQRAAATVKSQLRQALMAHLVTLGPSWLSAQRTGQLTALATQGLDALDAYFARYLPQLVLAAIVPLLVITRVIAADPLAGLTLAATAVLIPLFMALVGLSTADASRSQMRSLATLSHHFLDVVTGLATLKALGRAQSTERGIRVVSDRFRRTTMHTLRLAFLSSLVLELAATLSVALVAVGLGLRLVGGSVDLRTALLALLLAPEVFLPLRQLGASHHACADGLAAAQEVFAVLETDAAPTGSRTDVPPGPLAVSGLCLTLAERGQRVLDQVSLRVHPGEVVALTGPTGAGKTTLLRTILGFQRPDSGGVSLGGLALDDAQPRAWLDRFAWAPQHPALIAGTVADNVRLGAPAAGPDQVRAAAALAGVSDLLGAVVGEHGAGLSAGQRRRVSLARAFLREAPVLLLDEPTAGLDAQAEAHIGESLRALAAAGHAVLVVSHRPALLGLADRVVTLPEGRDREAAA